MIGPPQKTEPEETSATRLVTVAVPVPHLPALTYRVPCDSPYPRAGTRVRVPLGSRVVTGCVVPPNGASLEPGDETREILECLDPEPLLPPEVLRLALWVAEYYACGPGDALATAMPPFAWRRGGLPRRSGFKTALVAELTELGRTTAASNEPTLGSRQRGVLEALVGAGGRLQVRALSATRPAHDSVRRLVDRGLVTVTTQPLERDPFAGGEWSRRGTPEERPTALSTEQQVAVDRLTTLAATRTFHVALLHGVTGSGKTEVYLRLATEMHAAGRTVLVLVPEIALTSAVTRRFRAVFGDQVAIQHSGLSDGERHDQWHRIRRGEVQVVVGTRSAVFAPLSRLGLIVVDEEHDPSYKQEESPRYHGRDVAVMRGRHDGALVVLGSATPSLESYHNTITGRYERVVLSQRIHDRPLATVRIVDMREEMATEGSDVVISRVLSEALGSRLERGEQALILLNRRGFASAVLCRQCGQTMECPNCSIALTFHRAAGQVRCHYCNYVRSRPSTCPQCAGPYLERVGFGTERIESEIARMFPEARVARLDRDAVRRQGAAEELLGRFEDRAIDILVGTQMIAKGHDFPAVTLVGVVSADVGLGLADFRASERTFQLLTQVAGRSGRGQQPGEAIIQSFYPEHYSIGYACRQAYEPFFEAELGFRRSMRYPPIVAMVSVIIRGKQLAAAMRDAAQLGRTLRERTGDVQVLGPAPAPITRLRGEHRAQLFLKGTHRRAMREAIQAALVTHRDIARRSTVDVDPLSLL